MSNIRKRLLVKKIKRRINLVLSELKYVREVYEDSYYIFEDFDIELNFVLDNLNSLVFSPQKVINSKTGRELAVSLSPGRMKLESNWNKKHQKKYDETGHSDSEENKEKIVLSEIKIDDWMKKLFKEIAKETHPDKISRREDLSKLEKLRREELYKKANQAISIGDEFHLLEIALELDVSVDLTENLQIKIIRNEIKKIKNKINELQIKVSWIWGENEGNLDIRTNLLVFVRGEINSPSIDPTLIKNYIMEYEKDSDFEEFKKNVERGKKQKNRRKVGEHPAPPISRLRKKIK